MSAEPFVSPFTYKCGCIAAEVGQTFAHGIIVCPAHLEPMAPYDHPEQPARATLELHLELEASTWETIQAWNDALHESLMRDDTVTVIESTLGPRE